MLHTSTINTSSQKCIFSSTFKVVHVIILYYFYNALYPSFKPLALPNKMRSHHLLAHET